MAQTGKISGQSDEPLLPGEVASGAASESSPTRRSRWSLLLHLLSSNWVVCLLIGGAALGFDLYRLGNPSIWFDEAFSAELARQPLPLLWHIIWGPEPNMELYYLFLHFWLGLTGLFGLLPTEWVVRLPSAIFAALSSVMVYLIGRRYVGIVAGIVGAGLYTLNFLQLVYAQQTRSYSLQLLLICIAWYALFAVFAQEAHARRWWLCFIIASTLAIYAHLFSLLILASQMVAFAGLLFLPGSWRSIARRHLRAFIISLLATGVLIIPMLLVSRDGPKTGWLPIPHLHDLYHLFQTITTNSSLEMLVFFLFCAYALFIALMAYVPDSAPLLERITCHNVSYEQGATRLKQFLPIAFALVCWLFVPIIISYVVSQGSTRLFSSRYLVTILPPLFLLVGMAVASLHWRAVKIAITVGLILLALYYVPIYYQSAQVEDWNSTWARRAGWDMARDRFHRRIGR